MIKKRRNFQEIVKFWRSFFRTRIFKGFSTFKLEYSKATCDLRYPELFCHLVNYIMYSFSFPKCRPIRAEMRIERPGVLLAPRASSTIYYLPSD